LDFFYRRVPLRPQLIRGALRLVIATLKLEMVVRTDYRCPMNSRPGFLFFVLVALFTFSARAQPKPIANPSTIGFEKFVLDNGLTLIVHEDHKAPIVAVNVWYHVGSKNEVPGKSGFAHLFEHLMFNGSENFNKDYFKALGSMGGTDLNGTTNRDRTNYFQNVPTSGLDRLLFLESDRMGHLLGAIDQAKLDEQRGVVQNEKRQGENQPYGQVRNEAVKALFPTHHPYAFPQGTVIGSMDDLNAASLKDVQEWFKAYYGPNNSTLVVAGDIEPKVVLEKVKKYFGDIPAGPPIARVSAWVPRLEHNIRKEVQDRVPQARWYRMWNAAAFGTQDADALELYAEVLGRGKTSRLFKRLVYSEQLATDVSAGLEDGEIVSTFQVSVTAKPATDVQKIEKIVEEEMAKLLREGPTAGELERCKIRLAATSLRGLERIGGFGGKSDVLAKNFVFSGRPDAYLKTLEFYQRATKQELQAAAKTWLAEGHLTLTVTPFTKFGTSAGVDRKQMPAMSAPPTLNFPALERGTLSNGATVLLAQRKGLPLVNLSMRFRSAGFSSDNASNAGLASLAMDLLDEGTQKKDALQLSEALGDLGAILSSSAELDSATVNLNALSEKLDGSLSLLAEVLLSPRLASSDLERLKQQRLATISQEKINPQTMALRILPTLMYGEGHPYAMPLTGSGQESTVSKIGVADVQNWTKAHLKPGSATVTVVGDISLSALTAKLEALFTKWEKGAAPAVTPTVVTLATKPSIYLLDRPGSLQSVILVGHAIAPTNNPDEIAFGAFNKAFGGDFNSRVNMNLRENKHWSYGVRTVLIDAVGQRPFVVSAPVQTDKTKESLAELSKEFSDVVTTRGVNAEEFERVQTDRVLQLPGRWETSSALQGALGYVATYGLPDEYYQSFAEKIRTLKLTEVDAAAKKTVKPQSLIWVVVGDRSKIEAGVKSLNIGELKIIDANGAISK
jgi:zinc protease